jgi:sulfite reductase alpha subunit-like flavoprotein
LLSNTGEGDPPENMIKFMNILKGKESIDEVKEI